MIHEIFWTNIVIWMCLLVIDSLTSEINVKYGVIRRLMDHKYLGFPITTVWALTILSIPAYLIFIIWT